MGAASHLGIRVGEYDARIRTFIPFYEEILDAAAAALSAAVARRTPRIVDLGIGSGALAARCLTAIPRARVLGIDSDPEMLAMARRRVGARLQTVTGDFLRVTLPRADAVTASFALHHVPTLRRKRALYARCHAALIRGGVLVNADCCLATTVRRQRVDRAAWHAHLARRYGDREAERFLRAWAQEDVYFTLDDELTLLRGVGFDVDVVWRRASFAVIVGTKVALR